MPRVFKFVNGRKTYLVGRRRSTSTETEPMDPEVARKLAIAQAVIENGEIHGPDRIAVLKKQLDSVYNETEAAQAHWRELEQKRLEASSLRERGR